MNRRLVAAGLAIALLASVVFANLVTSHLGLIGAGFGLLVPAGTYAAGLCLGLRDGLHHAGGTRWVLAAIGVGIVVSALFGSGRIAFASAVAFGVGEMLDLAVYVPLRRRGWRRAVAASNAVGAVVDTLLFLTLAGFPLTGQSVGGQMLVKSIWMTLLALAVGEGVARLGRRRTA